MGRQLFSISISVSPGTSADCPSKGCFVQTFLHLSLAIVTCDSAVSSDVSEVFALCGLGKSITGYILLRPRLILVNCFGGCDLSVIPRTLDGIHSSCLKRCRPLSLRCCYTLKHSFSCLQTCRNPCPSKGTLELESFLSVQ